MKARYNTYIKLTYKQFKKSFPDVVNKIKADQPALFDILNSDPDYVVRISPYGVIEFGYESDRWTID